MIRLAFFFWILTVNTAFAAPCFWNMGQTKCLFDAVKENNLDDVKKSLKQGASANAQQDNIDILEMALDMGNEQIIKALIDKGANLEKKTSVGLGALGYALKRKMNFNILKLLLEKGANPNVKNTNGVWFLTEILLEKGDVKTARLLLLHGAKIDAENNYDESILIQAVRNHKPLNIIMFLLENKAKANVLMSDGTPLFMYALLDLKKPDLAELLLKYGANINTPDSKGRTALSVAIRDNLPDKTIQFLLNHGALVKKGKNILSSLIKQNKSEKTIALFLKKGAVVNEQDDSGWTPLMHACNQGNTAVVTLLLNSGANPALKTYADETPLMAAAQMHLPTDILSRLIKGGAKVNMKNSDGLSAIMFAARAGSATERLATVSFLEKNGADIFIVNKKGETLTDFLRGDPLVLGTATYWELLKKINSTL